MYSDLIGTQGRRRNGDEDERDERDVKLLKHQSPLH